MTYGYLVFWITCDGVEMEEHFEFLGDAEAYASELRPHVRGSLRIIDLWTGFPVDEEWCGVLL